MTRRDLEVAKSKVKRTGQDAAEYERSKFQGTHPTDPAANNGNEALQSLLALSKLLSEQSSSEPDEKKEHGSDDDNDGGDDIPQM
jgi:hypothetical protein